MKITYNENVIIRKINLKEFAYESFEAGYFLIKIKASMSHGEWLPWIKSNLNVSPRTVQNLIQIYEVLGHMQHLSELGYTKILLLTKAPFHIRSFILNNQGVSYIHLKEMTTREMEEMIKKLKKG